MGDLKGFVLAGHSFGGFISGHYAFRYPQNIKKLLLISPVGIPIKPEVLDFNKAPVNGRKVPKWLRAIGLKIWEKKISPFSLMRKSGGYLGKKIIKTFLKKRLVFLPQEE